MAFLVIHLLCVGAPIGCNISAGGEYPSFLAEYSRAVQSAEEVYAGATRRRSLDDARKFPFGALVIEGDIPYSTRKTIYRAFQYMSVLYSLPPSIDPIDIRVVAGTHSPEGSSIIGSWDGVVIRIHTLSITEDLVFIVMIHEMYHVIHFGSAAFRSLTSSDYIYSGNVTAACVSNQTVSVPLLGIWRVL